MDTIRTKAFLVAVAVIVAVSPFVTNSAFGYVLLDSQWAPGVNSGYYGTGNGPGGVTWSPMPTGLGIAPGAADGHGSSSTDIEFLLTPAVDGLEYSLFNEALNEWAKYALIDNLGQVADGNVEVGASQGTGGHLGDIRVAAYVFDGPSGGLAHAWQPGTEAMFGGGGTLAGDVHFDVDENWTHNGGGTDFLSVAIHEVGHALGLNHSNSSPSVMAPYYNGIQQSLYEDDILGIQAIYGKRIDTASNASFNDPSDTDILNFDFGTVGLGSSTGALPFDINNLMPNYTSADLDLVSITPSGDSGTLTTDLGLFTDLAAGDSFSYEASIDTSAIGSFSASYDIAFTDSLGTNQSLTLNITGEVDIYDNPNAPNLIYNPMTGEVVLDAQGAAGDVITIYSLKSAGGFFEEEFNPFLGSLVTQSDTQLGEGPNLAGVGGVNSIGDVFPIGMDIAGLYAFVTDQSVVGSLGSGANDFDLFVYCNSGDGDCDGDVDLDDVIRAVGDFTGPCTDGLDCLGDPSNGGSIFNKTRFDGDINDRSVSVVGIEPLIGDGDVDLDDLIEMIGAFTGPADQEGGVIAASGGNAGLPDLIYDPITGEVFLDATDIGGTLQAYNIKNAGGGILNGFFTPILGGSPATDLTTEIGEFQLSATPTLPGGTSIGMVFPVGMDLAALAAFVTGGSAAPSFGGGSFAWELFVLGPSVPEPSTFALTGIGLLSLALIGYRRRRNA